MKQLTKLYVDEIEGPFWEVGKQGVESITHDATGKGPMGYYDVIVVRSAGNPDIELPAHNCSSWTVKED